LERVEQLTSSALTWLGVVLILQRRLRDWDLGTAMKVVVVGGHARNIGKTSVMAGLIQGLKSRRWTAVKITQHEHGIPSLEGEPCGCAPAEHPYMLTEEKDPQGRGDTCRFLAAGARRSLWLRVRQGRLGDAFPALQRALKNAPFVIIESNSILDFLMPDVYLVVLDSAQPDFKNSARKFLKRADALVPIAARVDPRAWAALDPRLLDNKPVFPVSSRDYTSPDLCRFVRQRLRHPSKGGQARSPSRGSRKE